MPACQECYRAKKSCDRDEVLGTCSRCTRLDIPCVARVSRQGQGPKKRKRNVHVHDKVEIPEDCSSRTFRDNSVKSSSSSEDAKVLQAMLETPSTSSTISFKFHYGIRYLIHSWSSFALARRSFTLLERACRLAAKCQVPMNDIFCTARQEVIQPILYDKSDDSRHVREDPLDWEDIPSSLYKLCRLDSLNNRYVMIREAKNGRSRYLASDMFQKDIASVWMMDQAWKANEKPVVQLFLQGPEDFAKFTEAIHYQMFRYAHPDKPPECVRINGLKVMFTNDLLSSARKTGVLVQEMDLVYSFEIVTLEHSAYVCEFVPPKLSRGEESLTRPNDTEIECVERKPESFTGGEGTDGASSPSEDDNYVEDPLRMFDSLQPLSGGDINDKEFEAFLAEINDW